MQKVKCRTRYNSVDEEPIGITFLKSSLTQQHFKDECDVNLIAQRYLQTGVLPDNERPVFFGDVSKMPVNLMDAYKAVELAEENFMRLPSDVRLSINNDPAQLMDWIVANHDKAVSFGLVVPQDTNVSQKDEKNASVKADDKPSEVS